MPPARPFTIDKGLLGIISDKTSIYIVKGTSVRADGSTPRQHDGDAHRLGEPGPGTPGSRTANQPDARQKTAQAMALRSEAGEDGAAARICRATSHADSVVKGHADIEPSESRPGRGPRNRHDEAGGLSRSGMNPRCIEEAGGCTPTFTQRQGKRWIG